MIFRARHLQEDRLFECYLEEQSGEPIEPPAAEHLTDCAECAARYADLRRFMDGLRLEADAELDEVFPTERFRAQQLQIVRRLEHLAHPARVISFPGHPPDHPAAHSEPRVAPRWLGAAAAAGLLIGIGAGSFFSSDQPAAPPDGLATSRSLPVSAAVPTTGGSNDVEIMTDINDEFLSELEIALERPHTPELVALDEMTPHVREIRVQLR